MCVWFQLLLVRAEVANCIVGPGILGRVIQDRIFLTNEFPLIDAKLNTTQLKCLISHISKKAEIATIRIPVTIIFTKQPQE